MADAASTSESGTPTPASEPQPAAQDTPALEPAEDSKPVADTQPTLSPPGETPIPPASSTENPMPSFSNDSAIPPNGENNSKPSKASVECLSMKLDAFVLNKQIFTDKYFVAPLNVPDHSAFLPGAFSAPDVVPPIDLDSAYPWYQNSRIADVTKTSAGTDPEDQRLRKDRLGHAAIPDRWIILRFIGQAKPLNPSGPSAPAVSAFIVESNRIRHLGRGDELLDVELEAAPFINHKLPVEKQANVFLGIKRKFDENWADPAPRGQYHSPLTLLDAGNPLFADFQHHNPNVFSIHDDLSWTNADGTEKFHAAKATVSYAVFGYFSNSKEAKKLVCHGSLFHVEWDRNGKPNKIEAEGVSDVVWDQQPIAVGQDTLEALEVYLDTLPKSFHWAVLIREMKIVIDQAGRGAGILDVQGVLQDLRSGFKPVNGGQCWRYNSQHHEHFGTASHERHEPTAEEMVNLFVMDRYQAYIDALNREEQYLRHSLFCEWWKKRCRTPGGMWELNACREESSRRIQAAIEKLKRIKNLKADFNKQKMPHFSDLTATARPSFFSRQDPTILLGGLGNAWPSEFLKSKKDVGRDLNKLPFRGENGKKAIQQWLKNLVVTDATDLCTQHGMKLFFESAELMTKLNEGNKANPDITRMQELFTSMDNMEALNWVAPGWVREAVEALMQEWVYLLNKQPIENLSPPPTYCQDQEVRWDNTQPWRALFVEWELEYYHLPKRFWRLEKEPDGTAQYKIAPGVNISAYDGMDRQRRTVSGRSLLRPNAEWVLITLVAQLFAKLDKNVVENNEKFPALKPGANDLLLRLQEALRKKDLVVGNLEGFTDNLLTLNRGTHVIPEGTTTEGMDPADAELVRLLSESPEGFDVTPYRESSYSAFGAALDFKPVTHGQARFTKFNIVDKFGQVVSPLLTPTPVSGQAQGGGGGSTGRLGPGKVPKLYPCIGQSLACQPNAAEEPGFANSIELDAKNKSQYFQLGHRINQDVRLNTYFAVNSADWRSHHPSTQWFRGDPPAEGGGMGSRLPLQHMWRPTTEYEDPVWGWLIIDFRDRGIQVYNAAGESMGEALLPGTLGGTVVWQAYYAEGDLGTTEDYDDGSQLRELMRLMDNPKYLFGLWSVLADACQNIQPAPAGSGGGSGGGTAVGSAAGGIAAGSTFGDGRLLNLVGRPMALVNIGMSLELATPAMQTQSYADLRKRAEPGGDEIALEDYQFEVLLGDKTNLKDGLVGYFVPPPLNTTSSSPGRPSPPLPLHPFGYPAATTSAQATPTPRSPKTQYLLHPLRLHLRLRLLFRGGPMLIRGDLAGEDDWARPLNRTERVARGWCR
ncbi:hypothetical protein N0V88_007527 [Collariella sp. IMI 366227]|nr:hypothetical protein N0V88_007527 [Collariella sp. IMI 366227]